MIDRLKANYGTADSGRLIAISRELRNTFFTNAYLGILGEMDISVRNYLDNFYSIVSFINDNELIDDSEKNFYFSILKANTGRNDAAIIFYDIMYNPKHEDQVLRSVIRKYSLIDYSTSTRLFHGNIIDDFFQEV